MNNNVLLGAFLCLISAISWGAMFPVANHAFHYIDPFYFTIFRYGSVTIILIVWLVWKEGRQAFRLEGKGWLLWFFGTMAFAVYNVLIFWGQDLLGNPGTMVASIMESLMPMISIVIVWVLVRQRPHVFTLFCVFIGFVGASLVVTKGDFGTFFSATNEIVPSLLILIAVTGWVIYTMGGDQFHKDGWSALRYSTLSCLLGTATAVILVLGATLSGYVTFPSVQTMIITSPHIAFMVIFPGVIALVGWNYGVSVITPLNGLLFLNLVPVTTLVIQIFQGTGVTIYDIIGTIFIIVSLLSNNIFLRLQQRRTEPKEKHKERLQEVVS
ncbi:DMT family permease [Bacillus freudenreichii]|nr:DMT family permease [Bacillus freudenreichii]